MIIKKKGYLKRTETKPKDAKEEIQDSKKIKENIYYLDYLIKRALLYAKEAIHI